MKIKVFVLLTLLVATSASASAKGGIPILYSDGEEIEKVKDLPLREEFMIIANDGRAYHADLGILHEQFSLFYIPLINYGTERYVLYTDQKIGEYDQTYWELSREEIAYLQSEIGGIPSTPQLPFWDKWGGKLLLIGIIGIIFYVSK